MWRNKQRKLKNKNFYFINKTEVFNAFLQGSKLLHGFKRLTRFEKGLGAQLPEAYKKFWREWKLSRPAAVHYISKEGNWERDEVTGQIRPIQNQPLPLIDVPESHEGIWGGEAVIKGFQKRHPQKRRVPHFWVPVLRRSVVHSKVLNAYMSVVVTDRTLDKIHDYQGFDHYLLKVMRHFCFKKRKLSNVTFNCFNSFFFRIRLVICVRLWL